MSFELRKLTSRGLEEAVAGLKAIANPSRLQILCALLSNELTVGDMARQFGLSQSALSQHLSRMKAAGILTDRRAGNQVYYRLQEKDFEDLVKSLCKIYVRDS
jgi:ArsR family transcriptional regulator